MGMLSVQHYFQIKDKGSLLEQGIDMVFSYMIQGFPLLRMRVHVGISVP